MNVLILAGGRHRRIDSGALSSHRNQLGRHPRVTSVQRVFAGHGDGTGSSGSKITGCLARLQLQPLRLLRGAKRNARSHLA